MKTKNQKSVILMALGLLLSISCSDVKSKKALSDSVPIIDEGIKLSVVLSPPPPGKVDKNDTTSVISLDNKSLSDSIYNITEVDYIPHYINGEKSLLRDIQTISYPNELKDKNIDGVLVVSFIVEKDGSTSTFKVVKSIDPLIEKELIETLKNVSLWKPAKKNGLYVRSTYTISILFKN